MGYDLYDLAGHVGFVCLFLGKWAVIHKHRWGFGFWSLGAAIWVVVGLHLGMSSLIAWNTFYIGMYVYGYLKWSKEAK